MEMQPKSEEKLLSISSAGYQIVFQNFQEFLSKVENNFA